VRSGSRGQSVCLGIFPVRAFMAMIVTECSVYSIERGVLSRCLARFGVVKSSRAILYIYSLPDRACSILMKGCST
jgi:hypothetical protein